MKNEIKLYTHIERLFVDSTSLKLNDDVEGILSGDVFISTKLDGSNGSVRLDENGELLFTSRNRELSLEFDNQGFAAAFHKDNRFKKYLKKHPHHILFGEWIYTRGVLKYNEDIVGKFMVFDIFDEEQDVYLRPDLYVDELDKADIHRIPVIIEFKNPAAEDIIKLLSEHKSDWSRDGEIEGLVLKNYEFRNKYGRQCFGKIVKSEFKEMQADRRSRTYEALDVEQDLVDTFLTRAFIEKELEKLSPNGTHDKTKNGELLGRIWHELIVEEIWHAIKKYKNPKIDFARLHSLVIVKIKSILKEYF
jgi:hypothetical protein